MDYDQTTMPSSYDAGRGYRPEVLNFWLNVISQQVPVGSVSDILDLGCGTGRFSAGLAKHFDSRVVAIDPSEKMLAEAMNKPAANVRYVQAPAESIPLAAASVDLIFISMVFHHFRDRDRALRECHRVLRTGRKLCLRAGTQDQIDTYAYVPFFKTTPTILRNILPLRATIASSFEAAGFQMTHHALVESENASDWNSYAEKIAHRADSILIQLPEDEFDAGLALLRDHASRQPAGLPVVEPVDFFVFTRLD